MNFYDSLQMDPGILKDKIKKAETKKEKNKYICAMVLRSVLIVIFSILLISTAATFFGSENSVLAVSLLCILLSVRFVDFGYCIKDSLVNMGIVFCLLVAGPAISEMLPPILSILVHFSVVLIILVMTSDKPHMGNGGLYTFSYILLVGNPVSGDLLVKRFMLALTGYIVCGLIFYGKHHNKNKNIRFISIIKEFKLSSKKCLWQLQFALGLSLLLGICEFFRLERMMWAGFACASLLGSYSSSADVITQTREKFYQRIIGALLGSGLFALAYIIVPVKYHSFFGPLGGIILGFCTEYRHKTAINCFGALLIATQIYGLKTSVWLRIINNIIGAVFGYGFSYIYQKIVTSKSKA